MLTNIFLIVVIIYLWVMATLVIKSMWKENPEILDDVEEPSFLVLLLTWWMKPYHAYKGATKGDWSNE